jgi:hypothetical protein
MRVHNTLDRAKFRLQENYEEIEVISEMPLLLPQKVLRKHKQRAPDEYRYTLFT